MSLVDTISKTFVPIPPDGWRFSAILAAVAFVFWLMDCRFLTWFGIVLTLWCAYFFRDPPRVTPIDDALVISPADGRVSAIESVVPPAELDLPRQPHTRISVFMNVFDVHVNRSPVAGRIARITYVPGAFINAELDKASEDNERQALTIERADNSRIGVVQIAGLVARRIVKFVGEGQGLAAGERFGLIRFGSRVDVYVPEGTAVLACLGQRAIAGETVLAELGRSVAPRCGRSQ